MEIRKKVPFYIMSAIALLVSGTMTTLKLIQALKGDNTDYPHRQTEMYVNTDFILGIIFFILMLLTIAAFIKQCKWMTIVAFAGSVILCAALFIW